MMTEYRVVQILGDRRLWSVERKLRNETTTRIVAGNYRSPGAARNACLSMAVQHAANTNEPVLTVTVAGAFTIAPGRYPQAE